MAVIFVKMIVLNFNSLKVVHAFVSGKDKHFRYAKKEIEQVQLQKTDLC